MHEEHRLCGSGEERRSCSLTCVWGHGDRECAKNIVFAGAGKSGVQGLWPASGVMGIGSVRRASSLRERGRAAFRGSDLRLSAAGGAGASGQTKNIVFAGAGKSGVHAL